MIEKPYNFISRIICTTVTSSSNYEILAKDNLGHLNFDGHWEWNMRVLMNFNAEQLAQVFNDIKTNNNKQLFKLIENEFLQRTKTS